MCVCFHAAENNNCDIANLTDFESQVPDLFNVPETTTHYSMLYLLNSQGITFVL